MANTLTVDIVDMTVPPLRPVRIAIVSKPNPVTSEPVTGDQLLQLIQFPKYKITETATGKVVNGDNIYDYFPELQPGGGGGGGGGGIADRAIGDQDGNNIKLTYVKKADEYNAGKTVPKGTTVKYRGQTYTVEDNAEIFNNYSNNIATGRNSHAEGTSTTASASSSHAEGVGTWASGEDAHAEGAGTTASAPNSHAEGSGTTASGTNSHAEGTSTTASASSSHAEGVGTTASGEQSHAEGGGTRASANSSHAEGAGTTASGNSSHSEGISTIASSDYQHVEGKFNVEDANNKFAHIIGNGTNNARSNAFAIDWEGKIYVNNATTGVDVAELAATIGDINSVLEEVL
jgi:hypothetical protein